MTMLQVSLIGLKNAANVMTQIQNTDTKKKSLEFYQNTSDDFLISPRTTAAKGFFNSRATLSSMNHLLSLPTDILGIIVGAFESLFGSQRCKACLHGSISWLANVFSRAIIQWPFETLTSLLNTAMMPIMQIGFLQTTVISFEPTGNPK